MLFCPNQVGHPRLSWVTADRFRASKDYWRLFKESNHTIKRDAEYRRGWFDLQLWEPVHDMYEISSALQATLFHPWQVLGGQRCLIFVSLMVSLSVWTLTGMSCKLCSEILRLLLTARIHTSLVWVLNDAGLQIRLLWYTACALPCQRLNSLVACFHVRMDKTWDCPRTNMACVYQCLMIPHQLWLYLDVHGSCVCIDGYENFHKYCSIL